MQFSRPDQPAEIDSIFSDDGQVFGKAPLKNLMVQFAGSAIVARVNGMIANLVESNDQLGRKTFVYEQLQRCFSQGLPPGRPTIGLLRA